MSRVDSIVRKFIFNNRVLEANNKRKYLHYTSHSGIIKNFSLHSKFDRIILGETKGEEKSKHEKTLLQEG